MRRSHFFFFFGLGERAWGSVALSFQQPRIHFTPGGSVASSLCTTAQPLHTRFTQRCGAALAETATRPSPGRTLLFLVPFAFAGDFDRDFPFSPFAFTGNTPCFAAYASDKRVTRWR